jgi:hypothetical protein
VTFRFGQHLAQATSLQLFADRRSTAANLIAELAHLLRDVFGVLFLFFFPFFEIHFRLVQQTVPRIRPNRNRVVFQLLFAPEFYDFFAGRNAAKNIFKYFFACFATASAPHRISSDKNHLEPKERALSAPLHELSLVWRNRESFIPFSADI